MHNATYPPTYNHLSTQIPPVNNTMAHNQYSSNSGSTFSNIQHLQQQQMCPQYLNASMSNNLLPNQIFSSNSNSTFNQQPLFHYPSYVSNQHQQPIPSNVSHSNYQLTSSSQFHPSTNGMTHQ